MFRIGSPASGAAGTSCAGKAFTVSAPDAIGAVTFTPGSQVFVPVGNPCTVNFTINVLKTPTKDSDTATPGVQTRTNLQVTVQHPPSGATVTSRPSAQLTVSRALPTLTTQASRNVVAGTVADTATVTGAAGVVAPTGTVTFLLYGPTDAMHRRGARHIDQGVERWHGDVGLVRRCGARHVPLRGHLQRRCQLCGP